jgi:hypothetical protein
VQCVAQNSQMGMAHCPSGLGTMREANFPIGTVTREHCEGSMTSNELSLMVGVHMRRALNAAITR